MRLEVTPLLVDQKGLKEIYFLKIVSAIVIWIPKVPIP